MSLIYVVLGMHRSGTSLASSLIHWAGIPMCRYDCMRGDETQPYGYYEDPGLKQVNRRILWGARGNWHNPPGYKAIIASAHKHEQEMIELLEKRCNVPVWGWKDPRTALTVTAWHNAMKRADHIVRYVVARRDETGVVQSLLRRNGENDVTWAKLYKTYNRRIDMFLRSVKPHFIELDFRALVITETDKQLERLAQFIGRENMIDEMREHIRRPA